MHLESGISKELRTWVKQLRDYVLESCSGCLIRRNRGASLLREGLKAFEGASCDSRVFVLVCCPCPDPVGEASCCPYHPSDSAVPMKSTSALEVDGKDFVGMLLGYLNVCLCSSEENAFSHTQVSQQLIGSYGRQSLGRQSLSVFGS
eukprot:2273671-Amphidinium_carterae.1